MGNLTPVRRPWSDPCERFFSRARARPYRDRTRDVDRIRNTPPPCPHLHLEPSDHSPSPAHLPPSPAVKMSTASRLREETWRGHISHASSTHVARLPLYAFAIFPSPELACSARLLPTSPQHQPASTTTPAQASRTSSASPTAGPGVVKPAGSGACDEPAWMRSTMWAMSTMWTMANAVSHAHWAVR